MITYVTLYFRNVPEDAEFSEFIEAIRQFGKIENAGLSKPEQPEHKNGGWAWAKVAEDVAQRIEAATIVIRNRIVRVRRRVEETGW